MPEQEAFGSALKRFRSDRGLTQKQFVERLGGGFARSTVANVESGTERPSPRLWSAITAAYPTAEDELGEDYAQARELVRTTIARSRKSPHARARNDALGGPFELERLDLTYIFRESRSPEEILEVRTVVAAATAVESFTLKMKKTGSEGFTSTPEMLWGGDLVDEQRRDAGGQTIYVRRVQFPVPLRVGQRHTFAMRSWVDHDPNPDTAVSVTLTLPAITVAIHLRFLADQPVSAWRFGPLLDGGMEPQSQNEPGALQVDVGAAGGVSCLFDSPPVGQDFGVAWAWSAGAQA